MIDKCKKLFFKYYDLITYLIFGGLTTLVNWMIYLPCYNVLGLPSTISNVIAWTGAVAFAFLTNKPFVFRSHDWSAKTFFPELICFAGCRVGSGALETGILYITVDLLRLNGNIWKGITNVLVVVLNYVGSKLVVFRKKDSGSGS